MNILFTCQIRQIKMGLRNKNLSPDMSSGLYKI